MADQTNKIVLAISLAINILLIGLIAGHLSNNSTQRRFDDKHKCQYCRKHRHGSKKAIHDKFVKLHDKKQEMFKQVKLARKEVFKVLTAEEFDPVLYDQKSEELHKAYARIAQTMSQTIKETATGLSQKERIELVKDLKHFRKHG